MTNRTRFVATSNARDPDIAVDHPALRDSGTTCFIERKYRLSLSMGAPDIFTNVQQLERRGYKIQRREIDIRRHRDSVW